MEPFFQKVGQDSRFRIYTPYIFTMKTIRYDKKETTAWKYLVLISAEVFRNSMVNSYFEVINVKHIYFLDKFHELFFTTEENDSKNGFWTASYINVIEK